MKKCYNNFERRAEHVFTIHGVGNEAESIRGARPRAKIDAIIRDIQKANAEAEEDSE